MARLIAGYKIALIVSNLQQARAHAKPTVGVLFMYYAIREQRKKWLMSYPLRASWALQANAKPQMAVSLNISDAFGQVKKSFEYWSPCLHIPNKLALCSLDVCLCRRRAAWFMVETSSTRPFPDAVRAKAPFL